MKRRSRPSSLSQVSHEAITTLRSLIVTPFTTSATPCRAD